MTEKDIKILLTNGENISLEVKTASNELPKSIWETYSAFANTIGGYIILGVKENTYEPDTKKRFTAVGVENSKKLISDIWNVINSNKVNYNVLKEDDVQTVQYKGKELVVIHVPQADWRVKPIFLNENLYKGSFKRNHEGDFHCTESDVKAMIRDSNEDGNDGVLLEGFTLDDIDPDSLKAYRNLFKIENSGHPWSGLDDKEFLRCLGGYKKDRTTNKEGLTVAGLLMFGKGVSITERFSNFRMDFLDMTHLLNQERYSYRLTYDGRWENNFFQFLKIVLPKLTIDLPNPFKLEGLRRVDDTPIHKAVREALTNAIIHSDVFIESGILRIEKYDDKICLRNPGSLKLSIEQIKEGGISKARNPRIQNMLRMIGFGENIGSGFPKIIDAWKHTNWEAPMLTDKPEYHEVELDLYTSKTKYSDVACEEEVEFYSNPFLDRKRTSQTKEETSQTSTKNSQTGIETSQTKKEDSQISVKISQTKEETSQTSAKISQTKEETSQTNGNILIETVYNAIKDKPTITLQELAKIVGKTDRTVKKYIAELKQEGRIQRIGSATFGGSWQILK